MTAATDTSATSIFLKQHILEEQLWAGPGRSCQLHLPPSDSFLQVRVLPRQSHLRALLALLLHSFSQGPGCTCFATINVCNHLPHSPRLWKTSSSLLEAVLCVFKAGSHLCPLHFRSLPAGGGSPSSAASLGQGKSPGPLLTKPQSCTEPSRSAPSPRSSSLLA